MQHAPRSVRWLVLALAASGAACSTTSQSYVDDQAGYSVTKGRIVRIERLDADGVEPLADGVALKISRAGCRVALQFADGESRVLTLGPGGIVVCGYAADYVLRVAQEESAGAAVDR